MIHVLFLLLCSYVGIFMLQTLYMFVHFQSGPEKKYCVLIASSLKLLQPVTKVQIFHGV